MCNKGKYVKYGVVKRAAVGFFSFSLFIPDLLSPVLLSCVQ